MNRQPGVHYPAIVPTILITAVMVGALELADRAVPRRRCSGCSTRRQLP